MKDIINFLIIFLTAYGIFYIVSESYIFRSIREYISKNNFINELINCEYCLNFWNTILATLLFYFLPVYCLYPLMTIGLIYIINKFNKLTKFKI